MKKGTLGMVMIILILVIVAGLVITAFLLPGGLIDKAAEGSGKILQYLPGREEPEPQIEVEIDEEIEDAFDIFIKTLNDYKISETECLVPYQKLDFGKNKIEFTSFENYMVVKLINEKGVMKKREEIEGLTPCVVAGQVGAFDIAFYFYYSYLYLLEGKETERKDKDDYLDVVKITLTDDNEIIWEKGDIGSKKQRETPLFLYRPDQGHLCFFPVWDSWDPFDKDYGKDGLHADTAPEQLKKLSQTKTCSLP